MRITKRLQAMSGLLALMAGAGCGGGGGSAGNTGGATPPFANATRLRQLQVGDSWTYNITGTFKSPSGTTVNVIGTLIESIVQEIVGGQNVMGLSQALALTDTGGNSFNSNDITYFKQDLSTHNLYTYAVKRGTGAIKFVIDDPQPIWKPGTWGIGTAISGTSHLSDGSVLTSTLTVQGQEVIGTPVGSFTSWKTTDASSANGTLIGISWWSPEMGQPVKVQFTITGLDFSVLSLIYTLQSTTVPPQ